jgi:hypothetical protein
MNDPGVSGAVSFDQPIGRASLRGPRSWVYSGIGAALVLAGLQTAWYYVANIASLAEETRHLLKSGLLGTSVIGLAVLAIRMAVSGGGQWWKGTATTSALAVGLSSVLAWPLIRIIGVHPSDNSILLGESALVRVGAGLTGFLFYVALVTALAVLTGWVARLILTALRSPPTT